MLAPWRTLDRTKRYADARETSLLESPFKAKGLAYRGVVNELSELVGWERVLEACPDPELRAFLSQPFLAASWYDVYAIIPLCELGARLTGRTYDRFVRENAARQAREDLIGVYRMLLAVVSPQLAFKGIIKITHRYWSFGRAHIVEMSEGRALAERTHVPERIFDFYGLVAAAYIDEVMRAAGAKDVRVRFRRGRRDMDQGHPVADQHYVVTWR